VLVLQLSEAGARWRGCYANDSDKRLTRDLADDRIHDLMEVSSRFPHGVDFRPPFTYQTDNPWC